MKIAMLGVKGLPAIGGVAHYVEQLGARLVERGHEVTVYCRPHYTDETAPYRGMQRIVTRGIRGKHLDAATHAFTATVDALTRGFDLLHIHCPGPAYVAPMLRLLRSSRIVVTIHGPDWDQKKWCGPASMCIRAGAWAAVRFAHKVAAVSDSVARAFEREFGRRPTTIPTGVELMEPVEPCEMARLGLSADDYVFTAARLTPAKGVHHLVDAWERLDSDKQLVIAGDSPFEDDYTRSLLSRASDRIRFVGYVTGQMLAELYSNAYLYVQPSEIEGLSVSVLEALSYGRCVLASDIEPNVEALNGCGFTFASRDVDDLTRRLGELLSDPETVAAQTRIARDYIRTERTWERTVDGYVTLYEDAMAGRTAFAAEQVLTTG